MITQLIRSNLRNFQAYSSARSLYQEGLFLDANENSLGSVASTDFTEDLNRYPDPKSAALRKAIGKFLEMNEKNIFVGNGSDEIIDLLIRLFVETNEEIIITEPTYGMYRVAAQIAGVRVNNCPLTEDFQVNVAALFSQITTKTKLIFLCSPNNPTGTLIPASDIENICNNFKGVVIVDEAYIEFASLPSLVQKVLNLKNLVVMRTFSKAWGLAGIRVGYAVCNETVVDYLTRIKLPYNLNRISAKIAISALGQYEKMREFRDKLLKERDKLSSALAQIGFRVFPSEANFLLVKHPGASEIAKKLALDHGIIIRDFDSKPLLKDCVRISVGTPEQNELLLATLRNIL
jgi:histidinol-phosphate aminotransferase